ncbi:TonB-dependent receptor [Paraflavisolibacter sp. H34]|uniref:SusC/RagA family TonB-linked outer membrane protein n=1 Tax=Huijunlia imazamoxiresistens TaxID=3127457 RepID=UPI00301B3C8E
MKCTQSQTRAAFLALFSLALVHQPFTSRAQQNLSVVKGIVHGDSRQNLPGVSVIIRNSQNNFTTGTKTDSAGVFTVQVPAGGPYRFSFSSVGYEAQTLSGYNLKGGTTFSLDVGLKTLAGSLDQVVVVGYGTQRKSDLTGSVTQLKSKEINSVATSNVADALQGRAAGVSIMTNNAPGSRPKIRVRGTGSINASNDPLIVVDGFPLENASLNDFNSGDIASIEVLKDASSTAIYGSRGANGVIMITTKSGAANRNNVSVSSYYGVQTPSRLVKLPNREAFIDFINAAYTNTVNKPVYTTANPAPAYNEDWQEALIKDKAPIQNHTVSFSGGTSKTKYLLSGGIFSQDGLLLESGFKRYTVRTNLEHSAASWLTIGTHLQVNRSVQETFDPGIENIFRYGWPTMPVRKADGSFYYAADDAVHRPYVEGRWNPVADAGQISNETGTNRVIGDVYANFKLGKHLSFKTNFGTDFSDAKQYYFATSKSTTGWNNKGSGRQTYAQQRQILNENIFTYDNRWKQHKLTATAVYSFQKYLYESLSVSGTGFPSDITGYNDVSLASVSNKPVSDKYSNKLVSGTGRAAYVYDDRYLLTVTGRYDGSSRFGANSKWGFFPSVGLGWNLGNEAFMQPFKAVVSDVKVRGSYGFIGNQEIGNYRSLSLLSPTNYVTGSTQLLLGLNEGIGNPDLKWESTRQMDLGVDAALLKNRVNLTVDYYHRKSNDLIYLVPIPTTSGFSSAYKNIGDVENKGIEASLNVKVVNTNAVKWSVGGNVTRNKNKILSLYDDVRSVMLSDDQGVARMLKVGQPINAVYTRESAGIIRTQEELDAARKLQPANNFLELGAEWYVDQDGDGKVTSADYVNIGTTEPNFYYGINTSLSYKNLTLDVFGQGATNIATTYTGYALIGDYQIQGRNYTPSQYVLDRMWSPSNPGGTFSKAGTRQGQFSDRSNGGRNFFILRNVRLGYDLNPGLFKKIPVQSATVYVNAQNFFTKTNFRGYNPENGDIANPFAKMILFGFNLNF